MPQNENIKNLNTLLAAMSKDHLGKADFIKYFERVIKFAKDHKVKSQKDFTAFINKMVNDFEKVRSDTKKDLDESKEKYYNEVRTETNKRLNELTSKVIDKINEADVKLSEIKDGKDADEHTVAIKASKMALTELLPQIPKIEAIEQNLPELGEEIRNSLELLQGEERLDASAIKGLDKYMNKLGGGGGATSDTGVQLAIARIVRKETPTGNIDGSNKEYTVSVNISSVLSFVINGMAITDDEYTISGKTITFATAIPADLSGKSFRISYI